MPEQIKIMLDAGHYGSRNKSPGVPEYSEAVRMWKLHLLLKSELESYGFFVETTRENQKKDLSVTKRGKLAKGFDLFISLHSNAVGSYMSTTDRVDVYAPYDNINDSHALAARLGGAVAQVMGIEESYVKTRKGDNGEYYGVLRGARSAGCPLYYLIEHSFHTNERAARWLLDDNNLLALAKAEAAILAEYFGMRTKYSLGDVNGDGEVNEYDYMLIKRAVLGTYELSEEQQEAADINQDGKINEYDYILAKRIVLGTYTLK